ncbi:hypothetical protein DFQ28_004365 [Apophysomyces sp. BC1034]|nr:hypothetical protein DFQ30_004216 [Apophysomyces sp. BC1015]KAG0178553.1 hypothetical protein DFQ29_003303 [Apophysomyces sp. BC1021]KAG0188783.1 hypothetical protein DFQ28_004365 [Apophysomyces sp. BC1034]
MAMYKTTQAAILRRIPVLCTQVRFSSRPAKARNATVRIPDLKEVLPSCPTICDLEDAVGTVLNLLQEHRGRVLVLTGAGISTDSGVPDYRSKEGVYVRNPTHRPIFYHELVSSDIYRRRYWARGFLGWPTMSRAQPNGTHHALAWLLGHHHIGHIITQNVDNLHFVADTPRDHVLELHGTLRRVECLGCGATTDRDKYQHRLNARNPAWVAYQRSLKGQMPKVNPDGDVELPGEVSYENFDIPPCRNIDPSTTEMADKLVQKFGAVLVIGSSLATYSSFRLVRLAETLGKPIGILNMGPTRADVLASWKIELGCTTVLEQVRARLDGSRKCLSSEVA